MGKFITKNDDGSVEFHKVPIAIGVSSWVVGVCASQVVTSVFKNSLGPENSYQKAKIMIGCYGIGLVVSSVVARNFAEEVEDTIRTFELVKAEQAKLKSA